MFSEIKNIKENAYTAMSFARKELEEMKGPELTPSQKIRIRATILALEASKERIDTYRSTLLHRVICLLKGERHLGGKIQDVIAQMKELNKKPVIAPNKVEEKVEAEDDVQGQMKAYQEILDLDRQILRLGFSIRRWNLLLGFSNDRYQKALQECDQAAELYAKLEKNEQNPIQGLFVNKEDVEKARADWEAKKENVVKQLDSVNMQKQHRSDEEAKLEQATQAYHACLKTHPEIAYFTPDELKAHIELLKNNS